MKTLVLLLLSAQAFGQSPGPSDKVFSLGLGQQNFQSCGLVTRVSGNLLENLSPSCFQSLDNAYLDSDGSIDRRQGITQYNLTAIPGGLAVKGLWPFNATDGTKYLIAFSSNSMWSSIGNGSWSQINPNGTGYWGLSKSAEMQCVQSQGYLWCADGVDYPFQTNVTSTNSLQSSGAPIGSLIGAFRNRILLSGVASTLTDVYLSGELNGLDWSVPAVTYSTSAAIISINGVNDGLQPNCLMGEFQNQYYIGRDYDLWALSGYSTQDFALRKVSSEIGCTDPKSVQEVNKQLLWLSKRGVEALSGTQITPVSYYIRPTINQIIAAAGNSRSQVVNGSSFGNGSFCASGPNSCTSNSILSGLVVPSSWSVTNTPPGTDIASQTNVSTNDVAGSLVLLQSTWSMVNGNFGKGNLSNWTNSGSGGWVFNNTIFNGDGCGFLEGAGLNSSVNPSAFTGNPTISISVQDNNSNGVKSCNVTGSCSVSACTYVSDTCDLSQSSGTITGGFARLVGLNISNANSYSGLKVIFSINNSSLTSSVSSAANQVWANVGFAPFGFNNAAGSPLVKSCGTKNYMTSGSMTSIAYNTAISTPVWGLFNVTESSGAGATATFQTKVSGDNVTYDAAVTATPGSQIASANKQYIKYLDSLSASYSTMTPVISLHNLAAETTGYYISPAIQVSTPSSWGSFLVDGVTNGGSFTFWISTGATAAIATRTNANWTLQSPNTQIVVATTTAYIAARVLFSITVATQVPTLQDMTFQWNAGSNRPPTSSLQYYDRYYLFYTTNTVGSPVNDHAVVYDYNGKWTPLDDITAYSATLYLNQPFIGDSNSTGLVYQMETGQSDNGGNFTYQWQTADLDMGNPAQLKTFKRLYVYVNAAAAIQSGVSLTCSYNIDGSHTSYPLNSYTISQSPESTGYATVKFPFPATQTTIGHYLSVTCSSSENSSPLKTYGLSIVWEPRSWD